MRVALKNGFTLIEAVVGILLISIVFLTVAGGLSAALNSLSVVRNYQKEVELKNFVARYVNVVGRVTSTEVVNELFYNGDVRYPRLAPFNSSTDVQRTPYFVRYTFRIQTRDGQPASQFKVFYVYRYREY